LGRWVADWVVKSIAEQKPLFRNVPFRGMMTSSRALVDDYAVILCSKENKIRDQTKTSKINIATFFGSRQGKLKDY
jgi:hypothetical protein